MQKPRTQSAFSWLYVGTSGQSTRSLWMSSTNPWQPAHQEIYEPIQRKRLVRARLRCRMESGNETDWRGLGIRLMWGGIMRGAAVSAAWGDKRQEMTEGVFRLVTHGELTSTAGSNPARDIVSEGISENTAGQIEEQINSILRTSCYFYGSVFSLSSELILSLFHVFTSQFWYLPLCRWWSDIFLFLHSCLEWVYSHFVHI